MRRLILITVGLLALTVACGVPSSGEFEAINRADIPYDLANTSTSSTVAPTTEAPSTTQAPATTEPPETTEPATSTTTPATSTSISTELVDLYFATGTQLTNISVLLPRPASAPQVLAALVKGPPRDGTGTGLRAIIPPRAELTVDLRSGIATVDLPDDILEGMSPPDQRLMFGQIVLTLTTSVPRTGLVSFTLGGEPLRVFVGSGDLTEPGEAVSYDEYTQLLAGGVAPPPVTTSTVVTDTTPATATTVGSTPSSTVTPPTTIPVITVPPTLPPDGAVSTTVPP